MKSLFFPLALITVFCSLAGCGDDDPACPAPEQPLAEIVKAVTGAVGTSINTLRINCYYPAGPDTLYDLTLDENDRAQIFIIDSSSNPDFDDAVAILTNGIDDNFFIYVKLPSGLIVSGGNSSESLAFQGGYFGDYYPDLEGAEVTRIFIYVDNIWFSYVYPNTTYYILYRAVIMGRA